MPHTPPDELAAYIRSLPTHERHALVRLLSKTFVSPTTGDNVYPYANDRYGHDVKYFQALVCHMKEDHPND
jgi:hypothetical protein